MITYGTVLGTRFTLQGHAAICTSIVVGQLETHVCG